jgi:hypothetical protein
LEITFEKFEGEIPLYSNVRVTQMQHLVEVQYMEKINHCNPIQKLSKDEYLVLCGEERGTIKEFQHIENRSQSYSSLKQTFKKLRYLINNNFIGAKNELFITLTYAENMQDTKRLYSDFNKFVKRLKWHYNKLNIQFEYINVIEPQARGAWHCHVLIKFPTLSSVYIDNSWLAEKWGQGFVQIHRLNNVDNVGAYLSAYLADLELTDDLSLIEVQKACVCGQSVLEKEVIQLDGSKVTKKFIKGGRLFMYPPNVQLYRKSKGILMPDRVDMVYMDVKKAVIGSAKPNYSKGVEMLDDDDKHFNSLIYEQYNLKR